MNANRGYSVVCLYKPQKECNIGGVLRAAHCFDSAQVIIEGRFVRQSSNTTKAERHIPVIETDNLLSTIPHGCIPIAVEFVKESTNIVRFCHPERGCYIFGPENSSLPKRIMDKCKYTIYIPTKYCLNLACCVNVVLYDRMLKSIH